MCPKSSHKVIIEGDFVKGSGTCICFPKAGCPKEIISIYVRYRSLGKELKPRTSSLLLKNILPQKGFLPLVQV